MKKNVGSLLLIGWISFGIPLLSIVGCQPHRYYMDEESNHIASHAWRDAEDNSLIERCLWLSGGFGLGIGGGCLLGSLGITAAYFYPSSPAPERLLGKSPKYINVYLQVYKETKRTIALANACTGCAVGALVAGCLTTPWAIVYGYSLPRPNIPNPL